MDHYVTYMWRTLAATAAAAAGGGDTNDYYIFD